MADQYSVEERNSIDAQKIAMKEVMREWLDDQYAVFGRWTLRGMLMLAFTICIHLLLSSHNLLALEKLLNQALVDGVN